MSDSLSVIAAELTHRHPPLSPAQRWNEAYFSAIEKSSAPRLIKAGLHLWNDDIEACHELAQTSVDPDSNYWHAILHRREGDFSNSLYWYRRVGAHPVLAQMAESEPGWTFEKMVAECERGQTPETLHRQAKEMQLLLAWVSK